MERFVCTKDATVGQFKTPVKKGSAFPVLRTIMNECVLITDENEPNIRAKERELKKIGVLTGSPALGGV